MRIIFLGSPAFAVPSLRALHESGHELLCVVTQPDRPSGRHLQLHAPAVKVAAEVLNLPVMQPPTTRAEKFVSQMRDLHPEVLVVVAYGEILRNAVLEIAPRGSINLHASLLPKYRGAAPIAWAILQGEKETGASTMLINPVMDAGPVLLQSSCLIDAEDTTETLSDRIANLGAPLLVQTLDLWEKNAIVPRPQDESAITFAPKLKKTDGHIDWTRSADWISRQVRAFHPWPGSFCHLNQMLVKVRRARPTGQKTEAIPGAIIDTKESLLVACGEGTVLQIQEVQPQNRALLTARDFIHGYRILPTSRFS